MSYGDFTIQQLEDDFEIKFQNGHFIEQKKAINELPKSIIDTILLNLEVPSTFKNETSLRESIIAPVLRCIALGNHLTDFSNEPLNIDKEKGLNGNPDFMLATWHPLAELRKIIVLVAEAKQDNFRQALPQCASEMIAAQIFNADEKGCLWLLN